MSSSADLANRQQNPKLWFKVKSPGLIFMGTSSYAVPIIENLVLNQFEILSVVTQPDKPAGRRLNLKPSPVKIFAQEHGLKIYQPLKIRTEEVYQYLESMDPDLIITASYGKILTSRHLECPRYGVLNVHASLLPLLRGAAPVHWAIIRGFNCSGVTIMRTNEGMDTGPIVAQISVDIKKNDTMETLEKRLASAGAQLLVDSIEDYLEGKLRPVEQNHAQATYAPKLVSSDGLIDWNASAIEIDNLIRGLSPEPGAFTFLQDSRMKIYFSRVIDDSSRDAEPGSIIECINGSGVSVQTGCGLLEIMEVQPASRARIRGDQLIQGRYARPGDRLGTLL
jgi:methionyl-tRNA formyltransferase